MRAVRLLSLCLLAVMIALDLCSCGEPSIAQQIHPHTVPTAARTPTQTQTLRVPVKIENPPPPAAQGVMNPVRLRIPAIGLDASVESVGILPGGDLGTPAQNPWTDLGWYAAGPRPGAYGSAVIDGHLDRPGGSPAVFWYLRDVHAGDEVIVSDADGNTFHFHVTRVMFYTPQMAPLQDIFGNNTGRFLNLITCAGDWIPSQHQTTLRLVVFTSLD